MPATTTRPAPSTTSGTTTSAGPVIVAVGGHDQVHPIAAARDLASAMGREILALSVLGLYPQYATGLEPVFLPPAFDAERAARRVRSLRAQLHDAGPSTDAWRAEVVQGAPGPSLAEVAQRERASLIVMGLGRHRALDRLLGGETALQAIRQTPCPVLAVAPDARPPFHHAIVATDFGPASARAAQAAMPLLGSGATVSLVHVWQPARHDDERLARMDHAYLETLPERYRRLREALEVPSGLIVKEVVREGHPSECVLDHAAAQHADLVVAGRRKLRVLARLAVGSVTTAILRGAACSVLVAPEPPFAETDRYRRLLTGKSETHAPEEWLVQLREFTARNHGRRVSIEVDDVTQGAEVTETGYRLLEVAYDPHGRRLELTVGGVEAHDRCVTRRIAGVEQITVVTDERGRDTALQVLHGPGQTVLSFLTH